MELFQQSVASSQSYFKLQLLKTEHFKAK